MTAAASGPRTLGEFEFLDAVQRLVEGGGAQPRLGRGVQVGIGDDCAVVTGSKRMLLTTDCQIEGVHFRRQWLTPRELGTRAMRVAVSDIAGMGGRPQYVLLGLEIPVGAGGGGFDARGTRAIVGGVAGEAAACGASLVGGNVSAARDLGVNVTVIGEARRRAVLRSGARPGDLVFVTGTFGGAAAALRVLLSSKPNGRAAGAGSRAYRRPPLRIDIGVELAERGLVHAMVDVSDGLVQDLGHLCERSGVTIRLDADAVPVHAGADTALALFGGEDYELAFTAARGCRAGIERVAKRLACRVSVIGSVEQGAARVVDVDGRRLSGLGAGFDHLHSLSGGPGRSRPASGSRVTKR